MRFAADQDVYASVPRRTRRILEEVRRGGISVSGVTEIPICSCAAKTARGRPRACLGRGGKAQQIRGRGRSAGGWAGRQCQNVSVSVCRGIAWSPTASSQRHLSLFSQPQGHAAAEAECVGPVRHERERRRMVSGLLWRLSRQRDKGPVRAYGRRGLGVSRRQFQLRRA